MPLRVCLIFAALLCCCESLAAQALAIRTNELPWGIKGAPYHAQLSTALNGRCPGSDVRFTLIAGQLPKGLELFSFGIQGTPQQIGRFRFLLRATNDCAADSKTLDLVVSGKPVLITNPPQLTLQCRAGSAACPEGILRVEGSLPDLLYSIDASPAPWLKVDPAEGKTPDVEAALTGDRVHLRVDASNLAPGQYYATLKFYTRGGENVPSVQLILDVLKPE